MGFWNSVIYIATSWAACKSLFRGEPPQEPEHDPIGRSMGKGKQRLSSDTKQYEGSESDSMRALARANGV